jgi:hypothetical protein
MSEPDVPANQEPTALLAAKRRSPIGEPEATR